jgi:hypothetical protein
LRNRRCAHHVDLDWNATLLLDLSNRDPAVRAIKHAFDECALGIARAISKLWHGED